MRVWSFTDCVPVTLNINYDDDDDDDGSARPDPLGLARINQSKFRS